MALSGAFSFLIVAELNEFNKLKESALAQSGKKARKVLIIHRICNFIETFDAAILRKGKRRVVIIKN